MHEEMSHKFNEDSFIKMPLLGEAEAKGILMSSVMQYNHSVNSKVQDCVLKSVQECTLPLYSKVMLRLSYSMDGKYKTYNIGFSLADVLVGRQRTRYCSERSRQ